MGLNILKLSNQWSRVRLHIRTYYGSVADKKIWCFGSPDFPLLPWCIGLSSRLTAGSRILSLYTVPGETVRAGPARRRPDYTSYLKMDLTTLNTFRLKNWIHQLMRKHIYRVFSLWHISRAKRLFARRVPQWFIRVALARVSLSFFGIVRAFSSTNRKSFDQFGHVFLRGWP